MSIKQEVTYFEKHFWNQSGFVDELNKLIEKKNNEGWKLAKLFRADDAHLILFWESEDGVKAVPNQKATYLKVPNWSKFENQINSLINADMKGYYLDKFFRIEEYRVLLIWEAQN